MYFLVEEKNKLSRRALNLVSLLCLLNVFRGQNYIKVKVIGRQSANKFYHRLWLIKLIRN